jgi:hypothetical protein
LEVAWKVEVPASRLAELAERQAAADLAGVAELVLAGLSFRIRRGRGGVIAFENADVRGDYNHRGSDEWTLLLKVRAAYLATHALEQAVALCRQVVAAFGAVRGERVRRFDLAADYSGFPLSRVDAERVVTRGRRRTAFLVDPKDVDGVRGKRAETLRENTNARLDVTGITVGAGNCIMARIYDKRAQLALPGLEEKRAIEQARWQRAGWDGVSPVTRVEFQHRGEYLAEIGLRRPELEDKVCALEALSDALDSVWQRDVTWLRLCDPESATRVERRKLDARWSAVVDTVFRHEAAPVNRTRSHRGGARTSHAVGALLSHHAARGRLERVEYMTDCGEFVAGPELPLRVDDAQLLRWLREAHGATVRGAADHVSREHVDALVAQFGPREAVRVWWERVNGTRARFISVDDQTEVAR